MAGGTAGAWAIKPKAGACITKKGKRPSGLTACLEAALSDPGRLLRPSSPTAGLLSYSPNVLSSLRQFCFSLLILFAMLTLGRLRIYSSMNPEEIRAVVT